MKWKDEETHKKGREKIYESNLLCTNMYQACTAHAQRGSLYIYVLLHMNQAMLNIGIIS